MGKIIYKPTCSECGAVLDCGVSFTEEHSVANGRIVISPSDVSPSVCQKCGAHFDCIVVPGFRKTFEIM